MAKEKKKSEKVDAKAEKVTEREFKYGVEDLAEELGIKPASVRVQLRNKGIEKSGKQYGWNSKAELKEVIDQIKAAAEDDKPAKKGKGDDKPAKKGKSKPAADEKPAKKPKTKKKSDDEDEDDE